MLTEKQRQEKNIKRGEKSRKSGADLERQVRKDLESKGFICDRWNNNVEFMSLDQINTKELKLDWKPNKCRTNDSPALGRIVPAKAKWNNFTKSMMMSKGGFPDFIAFKFYKRYDGIKTYEIIGVEVKSRGYLDKKEKEKCSWLLKNNIFSKILIANKIKKGRKVIVKYKEAKL